MVKIMEDRTPRPTDLAHAASERVLGADNAGAGDPQRRIARAPGTGAGDGRGDGRGGAADREGRGLDVGRACQRGPRARPQPAQRRRGGPRPPRPATRWSGQRLPAAAAPSALATAPCKVGTNSGKTRQEAANSGKTRQEAADSGWYTPPLKK